MDGALAVLSGIAYCAFWTFMEWVGHRDPSEKERSENQFGLL
jgi:hypothetical protein